MRRVVREGYIEKRRRLFYAVLDVPVSVRDLLGGKRRFVQSLKTDDRHLAELRKRPLIAEWRRQIDEARRALSDPLMAQAVELRNLPDSAFHQQREDEDQDEAADFAAELRQDEITRHAERIESTHGYETAKAFVKVARGKDDALTVLAQKWQAEGLVKPREKANREGVLRHFFGWMTRSQIPLTVASVSRKVAGRYVSEELVIRNRATAAKYLSTLSSLWRWIISKGEASGNPWQGHQLPKQVRGSDERERAFTDDEVYRLLSSTTDKLLQETMMVLALTGTRIEEAASLRVKDIQDGWITIAKSKTNAGVRRVPVHPDLRKIIKARITKKAPDDRVFHDMVSESKLGTHSAAFIKRFGHYRERVGVGEKREGIRRSLVNLHSFRRWFITKAEQAGIAPWVIAAVVGHARQGMTLGVYSRGPSDDQLRQCIEAIDLPDQLSTELQN
jgi:integrase